MIYRNRSDVRAGDPLGPIKAADHGGSRRLPASFADALLARLKQGLSALSRGLAPQPTPRSRLDFWTIHEERYE